MIADSRVKLFVTRVRDRGAREALIAAGTVVLTLLLFGVLFRHAAAGALRVWEVSPTFNHCFLVLPLSLFLVWQRRSSIAGEIPAPDLRATFVMLLLSIVWLASSFAGVLEAQQFVIITMVQATLFGVLGAAYYRKLAAPFLYLYFLVPSGVYLIPVLQAFAARFAVLGLHVLGIPVFSNGAIIEVPAGSFAVAEACAGLRFLIASVAFGVFFAILVYRSWLRQTAFVILSVLVPIIANGFRVLGLIAAAQWIGNPAAALADHILYGWIFFSLVLVILVLIGQQFSDRRDDDAAVSGVDGLRQEIRYPTLRSAFVAAACVVIAALGPAAASRLGTPNSLDLPDAAPEVAPPWNEMAASLEWKPRVAKPSRSFLQGFSDGRHYVERFIALYEPNKNSNNLASSNNRDADEGMWSFDSVKREALTVRGREIHVRVSSWLRGPERRTIWSFYVVDGRVAAERWEAKWRQLQAYLTGNKCLSAYVAISVAGATDTISAASLLAATAPLDSYLCNSTKR
jgi:exosortase A